MRVKLTPQEKENISKAVENAEKGTSGEIATAIVKESSDYILFEFLFMIAFGLITAVALLFFGPMWQDFWQNRSWSLEPYQLSSISIATVFIVMGIAYLIANTPFIDRLIVPKKTMAKLVYEKALFHFFNVGLTNTKERTAILIFISLNERRVELIADKGINEKIDSEVWQSIIEKLVDKIKAKKSAEGLAEAVTECGKILKKEFPQKGKKKNQIPDDVATPE